MYGGDYYERTKRAYRPKSQSVNYRHTGVELFIANLPFLLGLLQLFLNVHVLGCQLDREKAQQIGKKIENDL